MIERRLLDSGMKVIAGVDEAGRGACAGPLVVAALILKNPNDPSLRQVKDSKLLSPIQRENLYQVILDQVSGHAIIEIPAEEIDATGLHKSNIEGMRRAVNALGLTPDYVLTDGYEVPGMSYPNLAVWKGDQVALTISAASIIAKVYRDRLMVELDQKYPGYGLADHKGYVTKIHSNAMKKLGITPIHRKSYANVAKLIK
ncbi:MAG: ribonuclease HII [Candidatus Nanopelagicaceae bacterium]|nr:ribonuclease HII [Candidatus Nanopelagicaceae bacterium]